jgi:hypothetical protein
MRNGVTIIPPHVFTQPARFYFRLLEVERYDFVVVIYGIKSTLNFIKILTIIVIELLIVHTVTSMRRVL